MKIFRMTTAGTLLAILTACGGGEFEVRDGPQAVHPSTSRLATGASAAPNAAGTAQVTSVQHYVVINVTAPCAQTKSCGHAKPTYTANDGSQPIID